MTDSPKEKKLTAQEGMKTNSNYLRGKIREELADTSNLEVTDETYELLKFHGSYFGFNRDTATALKKAGKDKEWEFMLRMKLPGGKLKAEQYLALDGICEKLCNGTLRITTRQTFQFHNILKPSMRPMVQELIKNELTTLGGCGDVVRNINACPAPIKDAKHDLIQETADILANHFAPKTGGFLEVWMDEEKVEVGTPEQVEPIYHDIYLPRKFKIGVIDPADNCIDSLTNDVALCGVWEGEKHIGWNVAVGGGLGMNHNQPETYPRLASQLVFVENKDVLAVTQAVVELQRDNGDRTNRKHARLKYVVEENGMEWTRKTTEKYFGGKLQDARPIAKWAVDDHMGWHEQGNGKWFLGVPVSSGRIKDNYREGFRELVKIYKMDIRLTADQNIIFCDIEAGEKAAVEAILRKSGIKLASDITLFDRWTLACVSLPTCGKALTEAERVRDDIVKSIEEVMAKHNLADEKLAFRIAGCPNGCSRPYVGDLSIVGRMPDHYKMFLGGDFETTRLAQEIFDKVPLTDLAVALDPIFGLFAANKKGDEGLGDFVSRYGFDKVKEVAKIALTGKKWAA